MHSTDTTYFPVELLTSVFSYLVWTRPLEADLVSATHVCRYWRSAALCDATLWAHVSATSVPKARVFFERSKETLLDVHVDSSCDLNGLVGLLRAHISRLRSLHVDAKDAASAARYLTHFKQFAAPRLVSFRLDGPDLTPADAAVMLSIYQDFYAFQLQHGQEMRDLTPSLQNVHMRPFCIPWSASIYRNLSVLDLRVPCVPTTCIQQLLHVLRQCPDLKSFRVHSSAIQRSSLSSAGDEGLVHLPRLATFHLEGPPPVQISELLQHLSLPNTTRYVIRTASTAERPSDYPVLPTDCSHLPGLSSFRAIEFSRVDTCAIVLTAYNSTASDSPVLTLTVKVADPGLAATRIAHTANVSAVETLTFSTRPNTDPPVPQADPHLLLWDFASLRTLRLVNFTSDCVRSVLTALRTPPPPHLCAQRGVDPASIGLLCPKLETFAMLGVKSPCRLSADVKQTYDERRRAECALTRLQADGDALDPCADDLWARYIEVVIGV